MSIGAIAPSPNARTSAGSRGLLAMGGRYRALYDLQLRPEDERPHDPGAMAAGVA